MLSFEIILLTVQVHSHFLSIKRLIRVHKFHIRIVGSDINYFQMSPIILIFFLVFIPFSQQHTSLEESLNDRIISEEVVEMLSEKEIRPSRVRRVPEQKNKLCGKQVLSYVMALCEKACDSS